MGSVYVSRPLNNVSIAAAGTQDSAAINCRNITKVRPHIEASGANVTVSVQASSDNGTSWAQVVAYAAGVTGIQAVLELPGALIRVRGANAGGGAQSVTVSLVTLQE